MSEDESNLELEQFEEVSESLNGSGIQFSDNSFGEQICLESNSICTDSNDMQMEYYDENNLKEAKEKDQQEIHQEKMHIE
jgi:hypothetical protein